MFSKSSASALKGNTILLPHVCAVVRPRDWAEAPSLAYVLTEDGEAPVFILRSRDDEWCFTDRALILLDGHSLLSKHRVIERYPYIIHAVSDPVLHTVGNVSVDVVMKFNLGGRAFTLDVAMGELRALTALYKALVAIALQQARAPVMQALAAEALTAASSRLSCGLVVAGDGGKTSPAAQPSAAALSESTGAAHAFLQASLTTNYPGSYAGVFSKYLAHALAE